MTERVTTETFRVHVGFGGATKEELLANVDAGLQQLEDAAGRAGYLLAWDTVQLSTEDDREDIRSIGGERDVVTASHLFAEGMGVKVHRG